MKTMETSLLELLKLPNQFCGQTNYLKAKEYKRVQLEKPIILNKHASKIWKRLKSLCLRGDDSHTWHVEDARRNF